MNQAGHMSAGAPEAARDAPGRGGPRWAKGRQAVQPLSALQPHTKWALSPLQNTPRGSAVQETAHPTQPRRCDIATLCNSPTSFLKHSRHADRTPHHRLPPGRPRLRGAPRHARRARARPAGKPCVSDRAGTALAPWGARDCPLSVCISCWWLHWRPKRAILPLTRTLSLRHLWERRSRSCRRLSRRPRRPVMVVPPASALPPGTT